MTRTSTLTLATILCLNISTFGQTIKLDQVKQLPSLDETNMKIIATSVWTMYEQAIKEPEKNSTIKAVSETVYGFYDTDWDGKLNKVEPLNGKQYSPSDKQDLDKNNKLLFNLTFDATGKLNIPGKIYVISHRKEDQPDRTIKKVGLLAFELTITDEIKKELNGVRLKNVAKTDINSLTGELNPVAIKLPFNLSGGVPKTETIEGVVSIKNGQVQVFMDGNSYVRDKATEILKSETDLLEYKKGQFNFTINKEARGYHIDINIMRNMVYSSQPKSFTTEKYSVKKFEGNGKKETK